MASNKLNKFRGAGNALEVKLWIQCELPPLSWNLTSLHMTPYAIKEGVSFSNLTKDTEFSERILLEINFFLVSYFNVTLPIYKHPRIVADPGQDG